MKLLSLKESKGNTFTHSQEVYLSPPARFKNNNGQNNILYLYYCSTVVILYVVTVCGQTGWDELRTSSDMSSCGATLSYEQFAFFLPQFVVRS